MTKDICSYVYTVFLKIGSSSDSGELTVDDMVPFRESKLKIYN